MSSYTNSTQKRKLKAGSNDRSKHLLFSYDCYYKSLITLLEAECCAGKEIKAIAIIHSRRKFIDVPVLKIKTELLKTTGNDILVIEDIIHPKVEHQVGRLVIDLHSFWQFPGVTAKEIQRIL